MELGCQLRVECLTAQWVSTYKFGNRTLIGCMNDYKIDQISSQLGGIGTEGFSTLSLSRKSY